VLIFIKVPSHSSDGVISGLSTLLGLARLLFTGPSGSCAGLRTLAFASVLLFTRLRSIIITVSTALVVFVRHGIFLGFEATETPSKVYRMASVSSKLSLHFLVPPLVGYSTI
jgi:hypothetical protein